MHSPANHKSYRRQLAQALADPFLGPTLATFASAFRASRQAAFDGLDFAALADAVAQGKDQARGHLMELYDQFKEKAQAAGAKVHLAETAGEANAIISRIAYQAGAKRIVKSKSMTAEETHLNDHLEAAGLEVVETDLGEWIIQLRGETPSHMVLPAIHLSRAQVAELFNAKTGSKLDADDITGMVRLARKELRRAFLAADMGVSGANFAVANTGTIGLMTNEGNARLVTTLPRVHVALVGLEKLVPDLAGALDILEVLPKNATAQAITSYVTWITGANACAAAPEGVKEMHVVFLDNGRLALAADPVFGQALRCIRCGACSNVCPIYGLVGGHHYGHVYIGAIGLILTYFYHGRKNAKELVRNCLNCQACKNVCPAGIDLPALVKGVQGLILDQEARRPLKNRALAQVMPNRPLFQGLLRTSHALSRPLSRDGKLLPSLPAPLRAHDFRRLPVAAARPLRSRWKRLVRPVAKPRARVALFGGCLIDYFYPDMGEALAALCQNQGLEITYPKGQSCCGLPAAMMSEDQAARRLARDNLDALDPGGHDYVLTLCASCASHLKHAYPRLLQDEARHSARALMLASKVIDFATFAREVLDLDTSAAPPGPATAYHAPCHLCRGLGVTQAPRELMRAAGLDYRPLANEEVCCGFGGSYSVDFPEVSRAILGRKLDEVEASGARLLVTDCPGCVLQLRGGLAARGSAVQVMHLAQAVAANLARRG